MDTTKKVLRVTAGSAYNPVSTTVELNGIESSEELTPKMARQAARIAVGHSNGVTVWDSDKGYRLYPNSARLLRQYPNE